MDQDIPKIEDSIRHFVSQKNYPCIAAIQSILHNEFRIGVYKNFGDGVSSEQLAKDLRAFKEAQKATESIFLSFFAVFMDAPFATEESYEEALWRELSFLSAKEDKNIPWDVHFSSDPRDKDFCFSFEGDAFFIVGMHPGSSRLSRRFQYPTLVFNLYEQFEELHRQGQYLPMIKTNRQRDLKFQGTVNPMVEKHSDVWEAIQFSGRENSASWQCPFKHDVST